MPRIIRVRALGATVIIGNMRGMTPSSRRQFLETAALGVAATARPRAQAPGAGDIIDFHAHWVGPHVVELLGSRPSPRPPQGAGWTDIDARLREMDRAGVRRQVIGWVGGSFDGAMTATEARPLWRAQNDDVAAIVRKHPARFSGLASLPTANVSWAADELERAHEKLGLIGAVLRSTPSSASPGPARSRQSSRWPRNIAATSSCTVARPAPRSPASTPRPGP